MPTPRDTVLRLLSQGRAHAFLLAGRPDDARDVVADIVGALLAVPAADIARHHNIAILARPAEKKTGEKKAQIPVEDAVEFGARLARSAFGPGKKVGIVEDADALNAHGQNALLKTLEEPKGDTALFLCTEYPDRMLATIRSRVVEVAVPRRASRDADVAQAVDAFVRAGKTDRLLQALALTKGDEAAGMERVQEFVAHLAAALHTTVLQECGTMTPERVRAHANALALLAEAPRALRDHANPTLVLEEVALALP
ncbi:hypothetical protein HYS28_00010 [Candidatus Uhrbacteria bacterium]|nr:hypothetical protein [Candidatus Uhrbacteria bacterium]